ncbi:putative inactive methylesterase 20 [Eucalyptus grandis]|uniref:putative inactive methylesterase 20 n=1 Tax=Eucalyptus grandis TaxID=71139 RepID=UPI00052702D5|nr:putative inactive methylesterase 20 [Eucalyptus grandis]
MDKNLNPSSSSSSSASSRRKHHLKAITLCRFIRHATVQGVASGINPLQAKSLQSFSEYFKPLRDVMEVLASREKVIIVGRSLGGFALSQVMEKFPKKFNLTVFVIALMPGPKLKVSALKKGYIQS